MKKVVFFILIVVAVLVFLAGIFFFGEKKENSLVAATTVVAQEKYLVKSGEGFDHGIYAVASKLKLDNFDLEGSRAATKAANNGCIPQPNKSYSIVIVKGGK